MLVGLPTMHKYKELAKKLMDYNTVDPSFNYGERLKDYRDIVKGSEV